LPLGTLKLVVDWALLRTASALSWIVLTVESLSHIALWISMLCSPLLNQFMTNHSTFRSENFWPFSSYDLYSNSYIHFSVSSHIFNRHKIYLPTRPCVCKWISKHPSFCGYMCHVKVDISESAETMMTSGVNEHSAVEKV
jgi:hypothetical protein